MKEKKHQWHFVVVGGSKRVSIETGEDLRNIKFLDRKLWAALACPVQGQEFPLETLQLLDRDADGVIHIEDVIDALDFALIRLQSPSFLLQPFKGIPKAEIAQTPEGTRLLAALPWAEMNGAIQQTEALTFAHSQALLSFTSKAFHIGDGFIHPEHCPEPQLRNALELFIRLQRVGQHEVDAIHKEMLPALVAEVSEGQEWLSHWNQAEAAVHLAPNTGFTYIEKLLIIEAKVNAYFQLCHLKALNIPLEYKPIAPEEISLAQLRDLPLAQFNEEGKLYLSSGLNPAWIEAIQAFNQAHAGIASSALDFLTETEWRMLLCKWANLMDLWKARPAAIKAGLSAEELNFLHNPTLSTALTSLMEADEAQAVHLQAAQEWHKLVLLCRDLVPFLHNFLHFGDFYALDKEAIFQAGTLYFDERSCSLCLSVKEDSRHQLLSSYSNLFLVYCQCTHKSTGRTQLIVAAFTQGDTGSLVVGRNGVLVDRKGDVWDALIHRIVENPISLGQAFWSPYRKVSRMLEDQIRKMAADKEEKQNAQAGQHIQTGQVELQQLEVGAKEKKEPVPFDIGKFVGIFAAVGLALGAIGGVLVAIISGFFKLQYWQMPLAIAGMMLAISAPSMLLAYLKLRRRDLAPLLDANGWAINSSIKINTRFGNHLTRLATLPKGATVNYKDPFSGKTIHWAWFWVVAILAASAILALGQFLGWWHLVG